MRLGDLGKAMEERAADLPRRVGLVKRKVALELLRRLTLATPVDTGRARSNWMTTLAAPSDAVRDTLGKDPSATILGEADEATRGVTDESIFIVNNLPYIARLNNGWSKQAPTGFVDTAVNAVRQMLASVKLLGGEDG